MNGLIIEALTVVYGEKVVIDNCNLTIPKKKILTLMGPSGGGKTTLLLAILGIIPPKKGRIYLHGQEITRLSVEKRNIGYLPQDYGLFPHMNVEENITFGLKVRKIPKEERKKIAEEMLDLIDLKGYENRKVTQLSGGQKQRVGLARALAVNPSLLLLDEPLSSIDQVTKLEVAQQMKSLFTKLDIPIIIVTHNHEEALFLAEDLAIMIDGNIEQKGTTQEIVEKPKTAFIQKLLTPFFEVRSGR